MFRTVYSKHQITSIVYESVHQPQVSFSHSALMSVTSLARDFALSSVREHRRETLFA